MSRRPEGPVRVIRAIWRVGLIAAGSLLVLACDHEDSGPRNVRENAFVWAAALAPGQTLAIRELRGEINVVPSRDDTARVVARVEWRRGDIDEALRFDASRDSSGATICAIWGKGKCEGDNYSVNLKPSFGRSRSGTDAKVFFTVQVPTGVKLDLVTIDGSILSSSTASVKARAINGDVTVATAVGPVQGETMNGSVDIRMSSVAGTDSIIASTLNGSASAYLPAAIDATVKVSTANGSAVTDFPLPLGGKQEAKRFEAVLGAGTHPVRVHSLNGEVVLRRLDAQGRTMQ